MQAFLYSSGDGVSCGSIPADGLLIQTPEGLARVSFLINEVSIDFVQTGSTAYLWAQPGGEMGIAMLEGWATVGTGDGDSVNIIPGSQVTIPLDDDLTPNGPPGMPEPYDPTKIQDLPTGGLERPVTPPPPASDDSIDDANDDEDSGTGADIPGDGDDGGSQPPGDPPPEDPPPGDPPPEDPPPEDPPPEDPPPEDPPDCPGGSCSAPGQGGECPGGSCEAPGQNK